MRKLLVLAIVSMVLVVSAGCQQPGLSQEEVKSIVEEEVARQLATMDELTISRLCIENEKGRVVAILDASALDGSGNLWLFGPDGFEYSTPAVSLSVSPAFGGGDLHLSNAEGEIVVSLGVIGDDGFLSLHNADGESVVSLGSLFDGGYLTIRNGSGETVVMLEVSIMDDGRLTILDKNGQVTFEAP